MSAVDAEIMRRMVETAPDGVVLADAGGTDHPVRYVNEAFESMTGYSADELLGRDLRLLQGEEREQDGRHRLHEALSRGDPCRVLLRNFRKDGSLFWNEMQILPLRDADGSVSHFVGYHRDAGERLRADPRQARDTLSGAHQPTSIAIRDDRLTGLYTLAYLEELLKRDWAIAQRERRSVAIFTVDFDALDLYNSTFGRAAGDSAIRRVAHCISGCLRRAGDVVRDLRIHHPRSIVLRYVSVSVGVAATVPEAGDSPAGLLQKSHMQLQIAKRSGRNQAA